MNIYPTFYKCFSRLIKKIYRVQIKGAENEITEGGLIVCANHISNHDVFILGACMNRQVHFAAKAELFHIPLVSRFVRSMGAFPIKRGAGDVGAIKTVIRLAREGNVVGFYPQGTRCPGTDPRNTEPKSGIGLVEYRSRVPVMPVCIQTKNYRIKPFRKVYVTFGKSLNYEDFAFETGSMAEFEQAAGLVFQKITEMIKDDV